MATKDQSSGGPTRTRHGATVLSVVDAILDGHSRCRGGPLSQSAESPQDVREWSALLIDPPPRLPRSGAFRYVANASHLRGWSFELYYDIRVCGRCR